MVKQESHLTANCHPFSVFIQTVGSCIITLIHLRNESEIYFINSGVTERQ